MDTALDSKKIIYKFLRNVGFFRTALHYNLEDVLISSRAISRVSSLEMTFQERSLSASSGTDVPILSVMEFEQTAPAM
jgi:hypothetical protein